MAGRWGWTAISAAGPSDNAGFDPYVGYFDSAKLAREHLLSHLDRFDKASTEAVAASLLRTAPDTAGEVIVTCPPHWAWAIYPVPDGIAADQAAAFFCQSNNKELWNRLMKSRVNRITFGVGRRRARHG